MVEIIIIALLLVANGALAMAEIAVVSARRARLQHLAQHGNAGARTALQLANAPTQFLSTVQIGITLVGILAGAFGGATLAAPLAELLAQVPVLMPYADEIAFVGIVVVITFFSLLIGELVPKRLALANPETIAAALAPPMRWLERITLPFVRILTLCTDAIVRLLRVPTTSEHTVTEEEIKIMLAEGAARGVFEETESEMVGRVFRFGDLNVSALMTPRPEIAAFDIGDSEETVRQKLSQHNRSRFPVVRGSLDEVLGIVKTKDLLAQHLGGQRIDLDAVTQPALFVPATMRAFALLEKFNQARTDVALVMDEYGGVEGIITLTDLAEAIVGDVPLSDELHEQEIVQRADGTWLVDGMVPIHLLKETLGITQALPHEADGRFTSVGGFVMMMLGRIPSAGDRVEWENWRAEVMDMDGRRVDKVLVTELKS